LLYLVKDYRKKLLSVHTKKGGELMLSSWVTYKNKDL